MTSDDTKFDMWLEKHPKLDHHYTNLYVRYRMILHTPRHKFDDWRERRFWKPGSFYLDHGYTPCALIEFDFGALVGVSLVDGKVIGGCNIYHCGPEKISRGEAMKIAAVLKKMEKKA
jgi:hypothetical protein